MVEKINHERTRDQEMMDSFQKQLTEKVWIPLRYFVQKSSDSEDRALILLQTLLSCFKQRFWPYFFPLVFRWQRCVSWWKRKCSPSMSLTAMKSRWSCRSCQRCWKTALSWSTSSWRPVRPWHASKMVSTLIREQSPNKLILFSTGVIKLKTCWMVFVVSLVLNNYVHVSSFLLYS